MDIREKVGLRIKALRLDLKLTQEKLAAKASLDKTYVNEVENGKRNVSLINLHKIIGALDISLADFFKEFTDKSNGE